VLVNISVNLEIGGRGPGTDGQGDLVVEEVDDQVEVDRLLPVHVRVADRQFPAVPPGQEIRNHVLLHDLALNLRTFIMAQDAYGTKEKRQTNVITILRLVCCPIPVLRLFRKPT
jgi:hypothetical protein